jgi:hypothetical protein
MDTVSGRGSVAINSRASVSVPVQAGSMAQRHGSPVGTTVVAGCSPAVHIDLAPVPLWPVRAVRPDRAAVPVRPHHEAPAPGLGLGLRRPPRNGPFASTLER